MKKVILLTIFAFLFSLGFSFAEVPCKINYQGRLIKDNVPVNGTVNMEFKLYDQLTGGTLKKAIPPMSVTVYNGLFRAVLDLTGIDWTAGQTIYLEVKAGTDILSPREEIYAYPYAINTRFLEGKAKDYFIDTSAGTQRKDGGLNIMGNVGVGTTSPNSKLDVAGDVNVVGIITGGGTLNKITSVSLSSENSKTISGLLPGKRYKLVGQLLQNSNDASHQIRFNTDTGTRYNFANYAWSISGATVRAAQGTNSIVLTDTASSGYIRSSNEIYITLEFSAWLSNPSNIQVTGTTSYISSGNQQQEGIVISGTYFGSSPLSNLTYFCSAGTMTGTITLYQLN